MMKKFTNDENKIRILDSYLRDFKPRNIIQEIFYILCFSYKKELTRDYGDRFITYGKNESRNKISDKICPNIYKIIPYLLEKNFLQSDDKICFITLKGIKFLEFNHLLFIIDISKLKWAWYIKILIRLKLSNMKIEFKIPVIDAGITTS